MQTERLILEPARPEHLVSLIQGETEFAGLYEKVADGYNEFPGVLEFVLEQLRSGAEPDWGTYLFVSRADRTLIGIGGYKGAPDASGEVEIGYEIAPAYRGRGLATETAQALIDHAFKDARVQVVSAHTLAEQNPSTSVLTKCGMRKTAELSDPEAGAVWRWEIRRRVD